MNVAGDVELSIVIGSSIEGGGAVATCVASVAAACAGLRAEIIVVEPSATGSAPSSAGGDADLQDSYTLLRAPANSLTPQLWARGLAACRGPVVAFTIAQCVVERHWARALLDAVAAGATVAGGGLELHADTYPADWGIFFLRYSAFRSEVDSPSRGVADLPGDNSAYRRDALDRCADALRDGLWEIDVNRRILANGGRLVRASNATIRFRGPTPFGPMMRQRFAHGRHSGATRVAAGVRPKWQVILAAPLVPLVMASRIARRARRADRRRLILSLPWILAFASAWSAGEACGAVAGAGLSTAFSGARVS
ncbi:MAG: glycosyltransferase [Gemmatimonadaceae bacterium]